MPALENKIPPPVVALVCVILMFLFSGWLVYPLFPLLKAMLVVLFFIAGVIFGLNAFFAFKEVSTTIDPMNLDKTTALVTDGIYQYSRNPMYASLLLILCAFSIYFSSLIAHLLVFAFFIYMTKYQIIPEEQALKRLFGEQYDQYAARTQRWITFKHV